MSADAFVDKATWQLRDSDVAGLLLCVGMLHIKTAAPQHVTDDPTFRPAALKAPSGSVYLP